MKDFPSLRAQAPRASTRTRALELTILTLGVTLGSLAACEERETDLVDEPQSVLRPIEEPPDPEVERWEFVRAAQEKLEDYERRITALEAEVGGLEVGQRTELQAAIDELEREREVLREHIEAIKKASAATWEPLRPEAERALEELETDYARVVRQVRPAL